ELARVQTFSSFNELNSWLITALEQFPLQSEDKELSIALLGAHYLDHPGTYAQEIEKIVQWCAQAMTVPEGQALTANWTSFRLPKRLDHANLVPAIRLK